MVSRCRSNIGKRPANTTCDTFRSIATDENGAIAKVEQSTPNLTSCGPCTSGVTRSSRMRSRCDLSENRAYLPPRGHPTFVEGVLKRPHLSALLRAAQICKWETAPSIDMSLKPRVDN